MVTLLRLVGAFGVLGGIFAGVHAARAAAELKNALLPATTSSFLRAQPQFIDALPWIVAGLLSGLLWFAIAQVLTRINHLEDRIWLIQQAVVPPRPSRTHVHESSVERRKKALRESDVIEWPN